MITTSDIISKYIKQRPFLEHALGEGIINMSSLSRKLKPTIEKLTMRRIKLGAIIVSLRRLSLALEKKSLKTEELMITDLIVRSNLSEYTYQNSIKLAEELSRLLVELNNHDEVFITFTHGVSETTILISSNHSNKLEMSLAKERLISRINNLSSVTIRHSKDAVYSPGVHYRILKALAWENINVIESISAFCEFTVIVENSSINTTFEILNELMNAQRNT